MNSDETSPFRCPNCHSFAIYRSRPRWIIERIRKHFTALRPYRCHDCGWRGWLLCVRYVKYPILTDQRRPPLPPDSPRR